MDVQLCTIDEVNNCPVKMSATEHCSSISTIYLKAQFFLTNRPAPICSKEKIYVHQTEAKLNLLEPHDSSNMISMPDTTFLYVTI